MKPKATRKRAIITCNLDKPISYSFLIVTETPSLLPFLREASKDALKFFPSASLVGPTMDAIGTKKPNRKSVTRMLDSVKPYTPPFYRKKNMIS